MDELPDWPRGTVALLATSGDGPHAIPVSTARRAGPRTILLALADSRGSLARLRTEPRCALAVLAAGDVAFTAHGRATIGEPVGEGVVAVRIDVDAIKDHARPTFRVDAGVDWRWTEPEAAGRDAAVHDELQALDGARRRLDDAGADRDRAARAGRGELHEAQVLVHLVVVVGVEPGLVHVERLRAVDVGDRHRDELEPVVHGRPLCCGRARLTPH